MDRSDIIKLILEITKAPNAFDRLEAGLSGLSKAQVSEQLLHCGIIPEVFKHDSSEEKMWAKYCDILFAKSLTFLNVEAQILRTRGDSADVFGKATEYTIVGDAKAFRLSRTAKNQKDFKVSALDAWRRESTYACLVAPLYQYPTRSSQIYQQAKQRNVTLLSYVHLRFLLDFLYNRSIITLWQVAGSLTANSNASEYWSHLEEALLRLTHTALSQLNAYKQQEIEETKEIGQEGIQYWESIIQTYHALSQS